MNQDTALAILKTGANVFLTGEPGSGKTHTINRYAAYLRQCGVLPTITASTGIAATHLNGMTVHSWSGIGIKKTLTDRDLAFLLHKSRSAKRIEKARVLVIDEISMLDGTTLDLIDRVVRAVKSNAQPFGGMQTVFVGDFFQLPPIARKDEPSPLFAFDSRSWNETHPKVCYLSEQHRQSDTAFLGLLSALRSGTIADDHLRILHGRKFAQHQGLLLGITKLFCHNEDVDRINNTELKKLLGSSRVFIMESRGRNSLVESLKRGCLSPEKLYLKKDAVVMCTKNNSEAGFVNGTLGTVLGFDRNTGYPIIQTRSGRRILVEPVEWSLEDRGAVLATIRQVPLRLAWAITIHKSQGISLDAALMDLSSSFVEGQGYVALSRVRSLEGLHLLGWNNKALAVHPAVLKKDCEFRTDSLTAREDLSRLPEAELKSLHENFLEACGGHLLQKVKDQSSPAPISATGKERRWKQTLDLILEGKTIAEAARIRGRSENTILEHLEALRNIGDIRLSDLAYLARGQEQTIADIHTAFTKLGAQRLKPIYEHFNGVLPYHIIRIARLLYSAGGP